MLLLYEYWKAPTKTWLSTWGSWVVAVSLTVAPWLFNPQSLQPSSLAVSYVEWTKWLYGVGNLKVGRGSWGAWAQERLRLKRNAPLGKKMQVIARNLSSKVVVVLATMQDTSEKNLGAVSRNAYLLVLFMDFFIGIIAYVTFLDDVQGNVRRHSA